MSTDRPQSVNALLGEAQRAISTARYDAALELLQQATMLVPEDAEVRQLLAQTERASRRHHAALARHQAASSWAGRIEALIDAGELEAARAQLREAGVELGKHEVLQTLEGRLAEREEAARLSLAAELADKARALLDSGDQRGALKVAEQSLRFAPIPAAREIRDQAGAQLDRDAERRQHRQAITEAADDVERLLAARELARAGQRLHQAINLLGSHQRFEELGKRIDRAKSDQQFRQRVEWAERRAREAEGLVKEAGRLSLKGAYGEAVERLEKARQLDPSHPDLDGRLETARAALERQLEEQQLAEELNRRIALIGSHLDALRLDEAEKTIRQCAHEYGEPERFASLTIRLEQLREAERSGRVQLPAGAPVDRRTEAAMLRRQQVLAAAYSWKQTFLFPFRGHGLQAFWILLAVLVTLDVLAAVPRVGFVFDILSALVLIAAAGLIPHVVRATTSGRNLLPSWDELADPAHSTGDMLRFGGLLALGGLPLVLLVTSRPWHGAPGTGSGILTWLAVAILGWLGSAFVVAAAGATEAFGYRQAPRLLRHARGLLAGGTDALFAIDVVFLLGLLAIVLAFVPFATWLFMPTARVITVYGLLLAPHLIGVLVRRHRLELTKIYTCVLRG